MAGTTEVPRGLGRHGEHAVLLFGQLVQLVPQQHPKIRITKPSRSRHPLLPLFRERNPLKIPLFMILEEFDVLVAYCPF